MLRESCKDPVESVHYNPLGQMQRCYSGDFAGLTTLPCWRTALREQPS